ncbi:BON domain-containing protein [Paractinoplanes rishiriensis]|uniref:BON domain-containing protein n=1 Tax=Paractinoplanes rishiriensis TaxID=1050105 RepID=A0A919MZ99_9ACTN|nr:BON domain-containing protein [Actinoplanes rishiriensis]GIF01244.1 hypothetical protein Ari01nite_87080 [Actinoplanes rishiriensis]
MSTSSGVPEEWFDGDLPDWLTDPGRDSAAWVADCSLGEDEWIAERAVVALRRDPRVTGRRLEVLVQNRVIVLLGDVDSAEQRRDAGRRAWTVPAVFDVANCLTVRGTVVDFDGRPA